MWREREKVSWKDVPHVNGTLAPDAGFGKKMYDACLARCPCAAPDGRDDFPALSRALLDSDADATQVPGVCFDEDPKYWFRVGLAAHGFFIWLYLFRECGRSRAASRTGAATPWDAPEIRNEFADDARRSRRT